MVNGNLMTPELLKQITITKWQIVAPKKRKV